MLNLEELIAIEHKKMTCSFPFKETDQWVNKISRNLIRALKRKSGCCYLINLDSGEMKPYTRGTVHNFEYSYMTASKTAAEHTVALAKKDLFLALKFIDQTKGIYCLLWA